MEQKASESGFIAEGLTKLSFMVLEPVLDSFYEQLAEHAQDINRLEQKVKRLEAALKGLKGLKGLNGETTDGN